MLTPLHPLASRFLSARSAVDRSPFDRANIAALADARMALARAFDQFGAPKFVKCDGHRFSAPCGQLEVTKVRARPITSPGASKLGRAAWETKAGAGWGGES